MNRYAPHLYVIPEDDRDRQVANGFVGHHQVNDARIQVMPPAGGWSKVLDTFRDEYIPKLRRYPQAHVVMLIDFDDHVKERQAEFAREIPGDVQDRVFVVGSKLNPEALKNALNVNFEAIGESLANDCGAGTSEHWDHEQLQHNSVEHRRLHQSIRAFLFSLRQS